jgi:hypothetical protein
LSGATIPFGILPSKDTSSTLSGVVDTTDYYSFIRVGNHHTASTTASASGRIADFRLFDEWTNKDNSQESYTGWTSMASGAVNSGSSMFGYTLTGIPYNYLKVIKFRPVTTMGNRLPSTFFNTTTCKPVLIHGASTGVTSEVGTFTYPDASTRDVTVTYTAPVVRFRFVDTQGSFPDFTLTSNPESFSIQLADEAMVKQVSSINGDRVLSTSKLPSESVSFSWSKCTQVQMEEIKSRAISGNSFFLIDHNGKVYFGKMSLEAVEEIVATVPSRYRVDVKFLGHGGKDDYRMG